MYLISVNISLIDDKLGRSDSFVILSSDKNLKDRMNIALVRATNRCIRGSRTPASNMSNRFRWEGGAGLGLLKSDN